MFSAFLIFLSTLAPYQLHHIYTSNETYYELPRFWTNTGFCPAGELNKQSIKEALFSDAMQMNLRHIAALPTGAVTHVRIHWLLELLELEQYTQQGVPIWDFTDLDTFIMNLDDWNLKPVVEFMGNPGSVFSTNPNRNEFLWEDLAYQVTKHYLNLLGASKVTGWRYESWNEPDLFNYNILNFTVVDYLAYMVALRHGLTAAGRRPINNLYFPLRGPAGLFKIKPKHPLCWSIVALCNQQVQQCPFDVLTYHRKGDGSAGELLVRSKLMLKQLYAEFSALKQMPISNDEADPISGWSTPHAFHEDVRYAVTLVSIVLLHWNAKLQRQEFDTLESISHDNAFLSYHPHEFSQRTLLAHFSMNTSDHVHSQFIQKPVYAALGMLSKLASLAADVEHINFSSTEGLLLKTTVHAKAPLYLSWLLLPKDNTTGVQYNLSFQNQLPFELCEQETYAYGLEMLEQRVTDPAFVWRQLGNSTPYPNATLREAMRRSQTPRLLTTGLLQLAELNIWLNEVQLPWLILFRVCSNLMPALKRPLQLEVSQVTRGEVLLTWRENVNSTQCLKTYEVWFQANETYESNFISNGWHLPFPSFHYAPLDKLVNGFYRIRGVDFFNRNSAFSASTEYIEL